MQLGVDYILCIVLIQHGTTYPSHLPPGLNRLRAGPWLIGPRALVPAVEIKIEGPAVPYRGESGGTAKCPGAGLQRRPRCVPPLLMTLCPVRLCTLPRGTERGHFTFHSEPLPSFHRLLGHAVAMPHLPHTPREAEIICHGLLPIVMATRLLSPAQP